MACMRRAISSRHSGDKSPSSWRLDQPDGEPLAIFGRELHRLFVEPFGSRHAGSLAAARLPPPGKAPLTRTRRTWAKPLSLAGTVNLLRILAVCSFVAGVALLILGFTRSGDGDEAEATPPDYVATPTPTATPTVAASSTAPPTPTPTPTAPPYDGQVARLRIPSLDVDAAIEPIGLVPGENQLDVPGDPHNVGWYDIYDKPGIPNPANTGWMDFGVYAEPGYRGNSVFSAHKDYYPDIRGPFNELAQLQVVDGEDVYIVVVMDNGLEYTYRMIKNQLYDAADFPAGDLIWPKDKPAGVEWITLITCDGTFSPYDDPGGPGEYLDRRVVVAERVDAPQ